MNLGLLPNSLDVYSAMESIIQQFINLFLAISYIDLRILSGLSVILHHFWYLLRLLCCCSSPVCQLATNRYQAFSFPVHCSLKIMQQLVNKRMILKVLMVFQARYCSQSSGIAECGNGPIKHWLQKLSASPSPCPGPHSSRKTDHGYDFLWKSIISSWPLLDNPAIIIRAKWGTYTDIFWEFWEIWVITEHDRIFLISKSNSRQEMVRPCNWTNSGSGNDEMTLRELSEETLAGYDVFFGCHYVRQG